MKLVLQGNAVCAFSPHALDDEVNECAEEGCCQQHDEDEGQNRDGGGGLVRCGLWGCKSWGGRGGLCEI